MLNYLPNSFPDHGLVAIPVVAVNQKTLTENIGRRKIGDYDIINNRTKYNVPDLNLFFLEFLLIILLRLGRNFLTGQRCWRHFI